MSHSSGIGIRLYQNDGAGSLSDVTPAGLLGTTGRMQAWADYDNDGDQDLAFAGSGGVFVYENQLIESGGTLSFIGIATLAGSWTIVSWADFDNDGDNDLYLGGGSSASSLFQNNLPDTVSPFTDETVAAGLSPGPTGVEGVGWADADNDGDSDVFVANCCGVSDRLFINTLAAPGSATFSNMISGSGLDAGGNNSASAAWGNHDNDSDLDLYVGIGFFTNNKLYRNEIDPSSTLSFVEVGGALNAQRPVDGGTATWADYDNDGDQDILGNGASNEAWVLHQNQLIETSGTPGFSDATAAVSLPSLSRVRDVIFFDMDRDADLDLLVLRAGTSPIKLYENTNTGDNSIQVSLEGGDSNRDGLGARLLISAGGVTQVRDSNRNTSLGRQEARRIHFGVGSATNVESLEVSWPSGCVQALNDLAVNQVYDIVETCDDEGPIVSDVVADPTPPVEIGTAVELTANVDDSSTGGSPIASADYAIDGGTAVSMTASDGTFDAPAEGVTTIIPGLQTGASFPIER